MIAALGKGNALQCAVFASVFLFCTLFFTQGAHAATRRLQSLEGIYNFRDLGGYKTVDGKSMKRGVVYRSDSLNELSDKGVCGMERLGLKTVVDFRTRGEAETHPDRLCGSVKNVFHIPVKWEMCSISAKSTWKRGLR